MKILVTGGCGFIGSHLSERLVSEGHDVLVIDNFETSRRDTLANPPPGLRVVEGSIADAPALRAAFDACEPDIVVHCAASYKDPDNWQGDLVTNAIGTALVVREAQRTGVRRLIYFQTALCYGNRPKEQPISLTHPLEPESSYAISKTAGEQYIALSGLEFVSLRLANVYGPRNLSGPIPTFYSRLSSGKRCFAVDTRRDFVYVEDLIDIAVQAVAGRGAPGYYHVSSGSDCSIRELYDAVAAAMGSSEPVEERPRGADDAATILLDPSRAQREFGWQARTPLTVGVERAIAWYRTHGVDQTYTHLKPSQA